MTDYDYERHTLLLQNIADSVKYRICNTSLQNIKNKHTGHYPSWTFCRLMQSWKSDEGSWLAVASFKGVSWKPTCKLEKPSALLVQHWVLIPPPQPALALSCPWELQNSLHFRNKHRTRRRWAASAQLQCKQGHQVINMWNNVMRNAAPAPPPPPTAARPHHRPLLTLTHPADQRQSRPADAEPSAHGRLPPKQHDGQQRASAAGPGHLLQSELAACWL